MKSLTEFTFASTTRKTFASRERLIVSVFATICWFHELRINLSAHTVTAVQRAIEPVDEAATLAASRRWWKYRNGRHVPSAKVVALAQTKYPSSFLVFHSPLWDALRLDRDERIVACALHGRTTKFGDELLAKLLNLDGKYDPDPRWIRKRCMNMVKHGSLEGLAVLIICMRIAGSKGHYYLAIWFYRFAGHSLLVLGCWILEHGIAQALAEYFEDVLFSACCSDRWSGNFSASHYVASVIKLLEVIKRKAAAAGSRLTPAESVEHVLQLLSLAG